MILGSSSSESYIIVINYITVVKYFLYDNAINNEVLILQL